MLYNSCVGSEASLELAVSRLNQVRFEIGKVIVGQQDVIEGVLICLIASGHVRPIVGARLPLEQAAEALELIDGRRAVGKVVLDVR